LLDGMSSGRSGNFVIIKLDALLTQRVQKALKDKGIEDMIAEARADNKDNDIEFMKPSSGRCKASSNPLCSQDANDSSGSLQILYTFALQAARSSGV